MRFIVIGDSKGKDDGINKKVLIKILKQSTKLNPKCEFIVLCGDNVAGSSSEETLNFQLRNLKDLIRRFYPTTPIIPVVGNHEVNNEPIDDKYEKLFILNYNDLVVSGSLEDYNKTAYYIDFQNTKIIVLNSFHYGEIHKITNNQLKWLEKIASESSKNKILFLHSPAFPTGAHLGHCLDVYSEDRDNFIKIVNKCNIDIIISGHEHNYSRRRIPTLINNDDLQNKKEVWQVITGGGGEKLRDKFKSKDGVIVKPVAEHHFAVVDVEDDLICVTALSTDGKMLDKFKIYKP